MKTLILSLLASSLAHALIMPSPIARRSVSQFITEGIFQGGTADHADLQAVRFGAHKQEGFERWVIDFSADKQMGKAAPPFQVRYLKKDRSDVHEAKFVFLFRSIQRSFLNEIKLKKLAQKSHWVKEIIVYPQIEGGDMAMEWILAKNVRFEAFEPIDNPGRIVVDIKG